MASAYSRAWRFPLITRSVGSGVGLSVLHHLRNPGVLWVGNGGDESSEYSKQGDPNGFGRGEGAGMAADSGGSNGVS